MKLRKNKKQKQSNIQTKQDEGQQPKEKKKGLFSKLLNFIFAVVPVLAMFLGLAILLYPVVVDWQNTLKQTDAIHAIESVQSSYDANDPKILLQVEQARRYNASLPHVDPETQAKYSDANYKEPVWEYDKQLALTRPYMAYLEIPKINIQMPIYHGTDNDTLNLGIGHLKYTSLPIPQPSTHIVVSAHSGMVGMRAFDDIRMLKPGDTFFLTTLGRTYAYKVYGSDVVLPHETGGLVIQPGKELMTLVTCTPYGVNDHRLLVHAERDRSQETGLADQGGQTRIKTQRVAITPEMLFNRRTLPGLIGSCVVLLVLLMMLIGAIKRRKKRKKKKKLEEAGLKLDYRQQSYQEREAKRRKYERRKIILSSPYKGVHLLMKMLGLTD